MGDPRRLGHAQRRRIGAPSNMYDAVTKPPSFGQGAMVKAQGRYGPQTVVDVIPNITRPEEGNDGHGYVVQGGKGNRQSVHLSGELRSFEIGTEELQ